MTRMRIALAPFCLLLLSGLAYGDEILVNGGFESGSIAPWTDDTRYGTGTGWSITSTGCTSGSFCATDNGNVGLKQTFAGVSTSSITQVSGSVSDFASIDFFYAGGGDDEFGVSGVFDATSDLRASATLVGFEIFGNTGGPATVDNLSILANTSSVPEPTSILLLITVMAAIGLIVARKPSFHSGPPMQ